MYILGGLYLNYSYIYNKLIRFIIILVAIVIIGIFRNDLLS